jgi:hypothetical protein
MHKHRSWRRGSESNDVFSGCQPQYPDLQGYFNIDFTGLQALFGTTRHTPDLTRHLHPAYSVIEEIVEGFVEKFFGRLKNTKFSLLKSIFSWLQRIVPHLMIALRFMHFCCTEIECNVKQKSEHST